MDINMIARKSARMLLDTKCVLINTEQPFTYTSGKRGPVYVDIRRLISFPKERAALMDFGAEMLKSVPCDFVAGGETAGIPYAAFLAERLKKPMLYVRKKPKGFGRNAQIEGAMEEDGKRVILVEDLQNDGGSKKVFVDALRTAGAIVEHAFVVFHYGNVPQSFQNMVDWGLTLHTLCTWKDVIAVAKEDKSIPLATLSSVEDFLADPVAWQDRFAKTA